MNLVLQKLDSPIFGRMQNQNERIALSLDRKLFGSLGGAFIFSNPFWERLSQMTNIVGKAEESSN